MGKRGAVATACLGTLASLVGTGLACTVAPEEGVSFETGSGAVSGGARGSTGAAGSTDGDHEPGTGDGPGTGSTSLPDDDESGSTSSSTGSDGATTSTTTGEVGRVGGGCSADATTVLHNDINGAIFQGALRYPGATAGSPNASILVLAPADLCDLTITVDPADADGLAVVLRDAHDLPIAGASCESMGGAACTVELADGPDMPMVLRLEMRDPDGYLGQVQLSLSATTEGISEAPDVDWSFRGMKHADYVIWPVGPATGSYAYAWEATTQTPFNVGLISPTGALTAELDTLAPQTTQWPSSGSPQGWYILGVSTSDPAGTGDSWSFGVSK